MKLRTPSAWQTNIEISCIAANSLPLNSVALIGCLTLPDIPQQILNFNDFQFSLYLPNFTIPTEQVTKNRKAVTTERKFSCKICQQFKHGTQLTNYISQTKENRPHV